MAQIKYVSVHERESDGERRIKPGKGEESHSTIRISEDGSEWDRSDWKRVASFDLPEPMPKSNFVDWWNENLESENEPEVIDIVLRLMGQRGGDD